MTQAPETGETSQNPDQPQTARVVPLTVHAQYIKDLSFENPSAPQSLLPGQAVPKMGVNVTLDARKIEGPGQVPDTTTFEVLLHVEASARREQDVVFLVQLDYAVVCSVAAAVPEQHHHPLLMIEIPKLAFPFARQILAEVTSQAGFPPLLLNPVDFEGMYREQYLAQAQAANKKAV
ncbi:MAG: protein-export chaperone SecB [Rhodospirillales bacterium]|nr:protein-export chaperone SecB [Alphaproteobacteria bacterium]MCB9986601.1 protein-export chaperone SecB [Rhodospirillales bacterium]USO06869.1 MAG: protein-export chaperone SecB [Rhodospirillales bacterium]